MAISHQTDILKIIDETGLLSQIDDMSMLEFREHLQEKGYCNLYDLATIALLVYGFLTGKGMIEFQNTSEDLEMRFIRKYRLTIDETTTLKMVAEGLTNQEIADILRVITNDGVKKRVNNILDKLGVPNRIKASVKAAKEGLI